MFVISLGFLGCPHIWRRAETRALGGLGPATDGMSVDTVALEVPAGGTPEGGAPGEGTPGGGGEKTPDKPDTPEKSK